MTEDEDNVRALAEHKARISAVLDTVDQIRPMLQDFNAGMHGAALAQLLVWWLMGHDKQARASALDLHVYSVRAMLASREKREKDE
jgi:hypothetical protein